MEATTKLRLLCWDHPRASDPLRAAVDAYRRIEPTVRIDVATRPLAAFNDEPIEDAAARADLIVFDHPMVPRAAERGTLRAVDDLVDQATDGVETATVGDSAASYRYEGRTWAFPIDAACQVMAARTDLLAELGAAVPTTLDELLDVARDHPGRVTMPLHPSDAICTLLTLSVAHARAAGEPDTWLRRDAVDTLSALVNRMDPRAFGRNPPAVLASMREHDDCALAPFTFGYASVARLPGPRRISWHDLPTVGGMRASILGGAGLGISAASPHLRAAGRFAAWFATPAVQRTLALPNGAQPASLMVWDDHVADEFVCGFFSGTRRTMDAAFVRPAHAWWPEFQQRAGVVLVDRLERHESAALIHDELCNLYDRYNRRHQPHVGARTEEQLP